MNARFIQIHSLHGFPAVLLNRDESGMAKRLLYGNALRTRISSQCLKRHWRTTSSPHSLGSIDQEPASIRSRNTVARRVIEPLRDAKYNAEVVTAIDAAFETAIYGASADEGEKHRQPLLLGEPEIRWLASQAEAIAKAHGSDPKAAAKAAREWKAASKANLRAMRALTKMPGGLIAALFGRMMTADPAANSEAAIHVAHSLTVHGEETESDFFTTVDDLAKVGEEGSSGYMGEAELTSGLFYGYTVVDIAQLVANLGDDRVLAEEIVERLVWLIGTVTPGAKRGPTAPYNYASWLLVETGRRQPRSLAEAFRMPCKAQTAAAEERIADHIRCMDEAYGSDDERRYMSIGQHAVIPGSKRVSGMKKLVRFTRDAIGGAA